MGNDVKTLQDVEMYIASELRKGRAWDNGLFDEIVRMKPVTSAVADVAKRLSWIDTSVSTESMEIVLLGIIWEELPGFNVEAARNFASAFKGFVSNCANRLDKTLTGKGRAERKRDKESAQMARTIGRASEPVVSQQTLADYQIQCSEMMFAEAIRTLEPPRDILIRLVGFFGLSQKQAAQAVGISESRASELISEAKVILKDELADRLAGFK